MCVGRIRLHNDDFGYESNCFVCETRNAGGLRIPFVHDTDRDLVVAEFSLDATYSGAPTMVHGGVSLAILDEAMAWACIAIGRRWAVTSETSSRFHRAVRVGKNYSVEAEIVEQTHGEIVTAARIVDAKTTVRVESRATFTILGDAQIKRAAGIERDAALDPSIRLD